MEKLKLNKIVPIIVFVGFSLLAGFLSNLLSGDTAGLYSTLNLPPLSPPGPVFGIVWGILYTMIGISSGIIYNDNSEKSKEALSWFFLQLVLNIMWPVIFFRFEQYFLALIAIILLDILVIKTYLSFKEIDKTAAYLLIPYIVWLLFATYLNLGIAILN